MLRVIHEKLGDILAKQGLISEEALKRALDEQAKKGFRQKHLGSFLVDLGYVTERDVIKALGIQFNLPVMDLKGIRVTKEILDLIPEAMARRYTILPLFRVEKELTVTLCDPTDISLLDVLANQTRCKIQPVLALEREIREAIDAHFAGKPSVAGGPSSADLLGPEEIERLKRAGKEIPIIKIVDNLLASAVEEGASDIHIEPREEQVQVRLRVDGILRDFASFPPGLHPGIASRVKILARLDISERQKPQDGRIQLKTSGREIDLRVSSLPTAHGEKLVLRLLDREKVRLTLDDLGFSQSNLDAFQALITQPYGVILVTGPTGSGKSTTLYAALNAVKSVENNLITVEDPVEYQIPLINQVQVNLKKELTFANALRAILRQDPDIIMVGEIRDPETGAIATEAALTGHLVFSTLHTNDAPGAITRLIDMGIEPFLLAPSLLGIVAQRLVRQLCPACKIEYAPRRDELERVRIPDPGPDIPFFRAKGCRECKSLGYRGRVGIHEVLTVDSAIRELISQKASLEEIRRHAETQGFVEMKIDGIKKVVAGITSLEEVLRVTRSR